MADLDRIQQEEKGRSRVPSPSLTRLLGGKRATQG